MNYLAHFQLSHGNNGLMIGALLGDVVKGPLKGKHPCSWEQGIQLHRSIDAYTDSHTIIRNCCQLFPKPYRRFSGIMLDMAFDHFLTLHWREFHEENLPSFSTHIYQLLQQSKLPEAGRKKAEHIIQHDLLNHYQDWSFIIDVIASIGGRMRVNNPLAQASEVLDEQYQQIEASFLSFYPQLQQQVDLIKTTMHKKSDIAKY